MDGKEEKPKSRLSEDVIYGIAEQMFFKKPFNNPRLSEIDFTKQNPYTIFMGHCQVHMNAMIAQFAKMKRIEFCKSNGRDDIRFYKNRDIFSCFSFNQEKNAFSGPYRVTKKMLSGIVDYRKLRVSSVQTYNFLKPVSSADQALANLAEKKPIEIFSSLFLDTNISQEFAKCYELNIEHLQVIEPVKVIEANLRSLLALNSVQIYLYPGNFDDTFHSSPESIFFDCSTSTQSSGMYCCATRTKKIIVNFGFTLELPFEDFNLFGLKWQWQEQARFLVNSCPNLEHLEYGLKIYFLSDLSPEQIMRQLNELVKIIKDLLEQLEEGGEKLHVYIEFSSICADQGSIQALSSLDINKNGDDDDDEQMLFKLGTPFVVDAYEEDDESLYIARSITIVDKMGRTHLCKFKVFEAAPIPPESPTSEASIFDLCDDLDSFYIGNDW